VITVPYVGTATASSTSLTINLTNKLTFATTTTANKRAERRSHIVASVGRAASAAAERATASPVHTGQGVTWPTVDPTTMSTPPAQVPRVQSFGTEVATNATTALTWNNLRPGRI